MSRLLVCCVVLLSVSPLQAGSQSCNNSMLTYEDIRHLSTNCTVYSCSIKTSRGQTYFFQHLMIPCNGSIVNWTAAGKLEYRDIMTNPTLILWRAQDSSQYILRQQKIPLTQCNGKRLIQNSLQIYTCELEDKLPVQEGDVLGMEVPSYDIDADMFEPYFDKNSGQFPKYYFRRGTTITTFTLSGSRSTRNSQPLVNVGIEPTVLLDLSTSEEASTMDLYTSGTTGVSTDVELGLETIIGSAAGAAAALLVGLFTVIAIQCCVILRYRSSGKKTNLKDKRSSNYSSQPYAIIDLTELSTSGINGFPLHRRTDKAEHIPVSKNPSYVKSSSTTLANHAYSMYTSNNDITLAEYPQIVLGETEQTVNDAQDVEERYATDMRSPHRMDLSHYSTSSLITADNEEFNYSTIEEMRTPEDMDIAVQLHQPYSSHATGNGNRDSTITTTTNTSEHIYY